MLQHTILQTCKGILHIGGHRGEEVNTYATYNKPVIWIEAISSLYEELLNNIKGFNNQRAFCELVSDIDGEERELLLASNNLGSSSMFEFGEYANGEKTLWPGLNLQMIDKLLLKTKTIDTLFAENSISSEDYDLWVIDIQGAELLALKGAKNALKNCKAIYTEISTQPVYNGGVLWNELSQWLDENGFYPTRPPYHIHDDILFLRK